MDVKYKNKGITLVELLAVLAIIAMLTGILIPSINMARSAAKKTKQKAQFAAIDQALMAFRSDHGDYPPSNWGPPLYPVDYCGAQKLTEALLGWDLLGFHPDSDFRALGDIADGGEYDGDEDVDTTNLDKRVGPYLELETANAFKLAKLFADTTPLAPDTFVLCDSFGVKKVTVGGKIVNAGTPILYYKADTRGKTTSNIYRYEHNRPLTSEPLTGKVHPLANPAGSYSFFYDDYITDPKVFEATGRKWPYRADSYILISAGADGLYGTRDDITNFGN